MIALTVSVSLYPSKMVVYDEIPTVCFVIISKILKWQMEIILFYVLKSILFYIQLFLYSTNTLHCTYSCLTLTCQCNWEHLRILEHGKKSLIFNRKLLKWAFLKALADIKVACRITSAYCCDFLQCSYNKEN